MRREDYERSYGRRGLHPPPPVPSSHSSRRSKKSSKRKMKCLISIGLILPALAAVIGVAAWAVSADVVMNSNGGNRVNNKADSSSQILQGISDDRNDVRSVLNNNRNPSRIQNEMPIPQKSPETTTQRTTTSTTTTTTTPRPTTTSSTTTTAATPSNADVSAILSKLISASGAASGSGGPRFVVVAPLPDHAELVSSGSSQKEQQAAAPTTISRADQVPTSSSRYSGSWKPSRSQPDSKFDRGSSHDLMTSESETYHQVQHPTYHGPSNITSRVGLANSKSVNQRHSSEPSYYLDLSKNNPRRGFNTQPVEVSGFESYMPPDSLLSSSSVHMPSLPQIPGFAGPFAAKTKNRGPPPQQQQQPPAFYNPSIDQLMAASNPVFSDSSFNKQIFEAPPPPPQGAAFGAGLNHGFGLKPIQQHLHEVNIPQHRPEESKRWGAVSFPPGGSYVPEVPKSISVSIGSPGSSHSDGNVIKSFFLPFLPKPKLNMNARVVFGVVLDKGMGFGGAKKDAGHLPHRLY